MRTMSKTTKTMLMCAALSLPIAGSLSAQDQAPAAEGEVMTTVVGVPPADLTGLPEGPEVEGIVSAKGDSRFQVTTTDGAKTVIGLSQATQIKSSGGFLSGGKKLAAEQLLNGVPVTVKTVQWGGGLVASRVALKGKDLRVARMIHNGTDQRFSANEKATEALRSRVADIDNYNVKGVTNVYFDTGKHNLTPQGQAELCQAASQAGAMENALLLVVGYTDDVGDQDYNQELSEKRASRVVNYLQQACGWKPYRMMTPTGMAEADPAADNSTPEGKAMNRRVSVNILVSKAVDMM